MCKAEKMYPKCKCSQSCTSEAEFYEIHQLQDQKGRAPVYCMNEEEGIAEIHCTYDVRNDRSVVRLLEVPRAGKSLMIVSDIMEMI
jgi:hypothetical protein